MANEEAKGQLEIVAAHGSLPSCLIAARGEDLSRKIKAYCSVCKQPVRDNVNPEKIITCGRCVQTLLLITMENKLAHRESFLEKGDIEAARSVESFINSERGKEVFDEPTKKFRRTLVRKRPVRKARPSYGKRPFNHNRVLDQGRP